MYTCLFDGFIYGLTAKYGSVTGQLMLKPWRLVTTSTTVRDSITKVCTHTETHARIQGRNTKISENYPSALAADINSALGSIY